MSQRLTIHRLLRYNNHASSGMPCCSIMYDLRDVPHRAFLHPTAGVAYRPSYTSSSSSSSRPLTTKELYEPATYPPVSRLSITCGLFPILWPIEVQSRHHHGVTILDVLTAIYKSMHRPVRQSEWAQLSQRQQRRIAQVFHQRCAKAASPWVEKEKGVTRVDCLVLYTRFAGISLQDEWDGACVLTLDRNVREQ